jgi:hypothetical protein
VYGFRIKESLKMNKIIGILLSIVFTAPIAFGAQLKQFNPSLEAGIFVAGDFTGVTSTSDGSVYLLAKDHRLVKLSPNGEQKIIKLPKIEGAKSEDYLCDIVADDKTLSFCGYPFSGIFILDLNNPEKFNFIELSLDKKTINPMMIAKRGDAWCVKDSEERTLYVSKDKAIKILPEFSEIEGDRLGNSFIIPPPEDQGEKIIYPGKILDEKHQTVWVAPTPKAPKNIMSVEYLGQDSNNRNIFLTNVASGELDGENNLYAVKNGKVVASLRIPESNAPYVMRYCRLSADDSILLVQKDPNNRKGILLKRLSLNTTKPDAG